MSVVSSVINTTKKVFSKIGKVITGNKKHLEAQGGQVIVGELLEKACVQEIANEMPVAKAHPTNVFSEGEIIVSTIASMYAGNCTYESIGEFQNDMEFYKTALGIGQFASVERQRQRIDQIGEAFVQEGMEFKPYFNEMNVKLLKGEELSRVQSGKYVPINIDVSPFDESGSHKEKVSYTYKKFDGLSPIFAYMGENEGFMINAELRPGSQHCQKGTPQFLEDTLVIARTIAGDTTPLLVKMDSGNDAIENIGKILDAGAYFIIKRNLRKEKTLDWLSLAKGTATEISHPREGKTVYKGVTEKSVEYIDKDNVQQTVSVRIIFEVTERVCDHNGQYFLFPKVEVDTYWDNTDFSIDQVIAEYHAHGTSEQFHSELKSDMNFERLASGKFVSNEVLVCCGMIAYNTLRIIGMRMYDCSSKVPMRDKNAKRRRLKTVIAHIILANYIAIVCTDISGGGENGDTMPKNRFPSSKCGFELSSRKMELSSRKMN